MRKVTKLNWRPRKYLKLKFDLRLATEPQLRLLKSLDCEPDDALTRSDASAWIDRILSKRPVNRERKRKIETFKSAARESQENGLARTWLEAKKT